METLPKLSPAQSLLLRTAARRPNGRVMPPDTLRGGARAKVLTALLQRGWVEPADGGHLLTDAGYAAIGQQRPAPPDGVAKCDVRFEFFFHVKIITQLLKICLDKVSNLDYNSKKIHKGDDL